MIITNYAVTLLGACTENEDKLMMGPLREKEGKLGFEGE